MSELTVAVLATSPDTYLTLDDPTGPAASDSSGNGHPGTYQNVRLHSADGPPGANDLVVELAPQVNTPPFNGIKPPTGHWDFSQLSIMLWLRIHHGFAVSECPAGAIPTTVAGWLTQYNSSDQLFHFYVGTASGLVSIADGAVASSLFNFWHCYVMTLDRSTGIYQLWRDGGLAASGNATMGAVVTGPNGLSIGWFDLTGGAVQPYTGDVGHAASWNRVITPAEILNIWLAGGANPAAVGNIGPIVLEATSPTTYVLGTASTGLTGSGTIAVPNCMGAVVNLTTIPASWGFDWETPHHLIPAAARILFSDLNGDTPSELIHNPTQIVWAPNRTNLFLRYTIRPGFVATITPILATP